MGRLDSIIEAVSPTWALRRKVARAELELADKLRGYLGTETGRLDADWTTTGNSADAELLGTPLESLRNRSRDLARNDPHAASAMNTVVTNVVGDRVRIQAKCRPDELPLPPLLDARQLITEDIAKVANRHAELAWEQVECSIDGRSMSFSEFLELDTRQHLEGGESFVHLINVQRSHTALTTAVELIEADRIMTPPGEAANPRIREGIEFDDTDQPVAYYVSKVHPGDSFQIVRADDIIRIDADRMIHHYTVKRPGQSRGEPWFAPALSYFRHKAKYMEAEIVAARIAACFAAFVSTARPQAIAQKIGKKTDADGNRLQKIQPGTVSYLRENESIDFGNPQRPGETFVPSINVILKAIGAALDIPFVVLCKDFSDVNYSSARAALLDFRNFIGVRRARTSVSVIRPIWQAFFDEAVMAGMIRAPGYVARRHEYTRFRTQWPGWGWVDPQKERASDIDAIQGGVGTLEEVASRNGSDYEEVLRQQAKEEELRQQLGLPSALVAVSSDDGVADDDEESGRAHRHYCAYGGNGSGRMPSEDA